ncbi:MAG TPA: glycosyltransferase [Parafilimonas sp.]
MKPRNKTLIIFSPAFAGSEADTVWLPWLQTLVTAFNRNYPELSIIVFAFQYPHTTKKYNWYGNKIIPLNGMYKKKLSRLSMWLRIFFEMQKIKKEFTIVGIFSMWCGECTLIAKYVSKIFNVKYLCWILGQDARKNNRFVKRIQPKASSLIAMSDFLVDEFYKNHNIKPQYVIPDGIDIGLFDSTLPKKDIDIVGAGSLSTLKQYNIFVEIISLLKKHNANIKAVLCGDGEEENNIKNQVQNLGLENNIALVGSVNHRNVLQTMQRAKILLHPSSYEGFGTVCVEALYAGAHVISFVQPMKQQIKNWHIVKSIEEMYSKTFELLQNPDTNYERVLFYTMNDAARDVLKIFNYEG